MLYYESIEAPTLELLISLSQINIFKDLRLVGGTSLALQIGHRKSVDLDLFGALTADEYAVSKALNKIGTVTILKKTSNISVYLINGIKVDIVNYPYPWLNEVKLIDNLRLADISDIAAMKLSAITGRGTRKDFIDLYFLLRDLSLEEMVRYYNKKYADGSEFMVLKSLTYFSDADSEEDPYMIKPIQWDKVKDTINKAVDRNLRKYGKE